jgi:hypothetical protein
MDHKEIRCQVVDRIHVTQDGVQRNAFVSTAMNIQVP